MSAGLATFASQEDVVDFFCVYLRYGLLSFLLTMLKIHNALSKNKNVFRISKISLFYVFL